MYKYFSLFHLLLSTNVCRVELGIASFSLVIEDCSLGLLKHEEPLFSIKSMAESMAGRDTFGGREITSSAHTLILLAHNLT